MAVSTSRIYPHPPLPLKREDRAAFCVFTVGAECRQPARASRRDANGSRSLLIVRSLHSRSRTVASRRNSLPLDSSSNKMSEPDVRYLICSTVKNPAL